MKKILMVAALFVIYSGLAYTEDYSVTIAKVTCDDEKKEITAITAQNQESPSHYWVGCACRTKKGEIIDYPGKQLFGSGEATFPLDSKCYEFTVAVWDATGELDRHFWTEVCW